MKSRFLLALAFFAVSRAAAVMIGAFPGLDQAIAQADAIVVLRIDRTLAPSDPTLYSTHDCFIYQCLKGTLAPSSRITLRLMDPRTHFVSPFAQYSTHLVFLTKKRAPNEPTEYRTLEFQGADLRLSPFGNEKMPEGADVATKIRSLLKTAMAYWNEQAKKENEFLERVREGHPQKFH